MDKALKQRLVGASVLVAFAVVVLPMLLSGQPESQQESRRIDLPPKPQELAFETRRFPIGEQDASQPSVLEKPPVPTPRAEPPGPLTIPAGVGEEDSAGSGLQDTSQAVESETPAPAPAEVPAPGRTSPDTEPVGRYLVQVASFSSTGNANRLAGQLREAGMPVLLDTVDAAAGRLHRVRVGPYAQRGEADSAIAELSAKMPDLSPRVLDLRPDESAPVAEASDPLIRWVVQVGSFSDPENAENLVYRLRDGGYRASSEAVTGAAGTAWKVRVGPVVERQDAEKLADSLKRDLGLDGLVMSAN